MVIAFSDEVQAAAIAEPTPVVLCPEGKTRTRLEMPGRNQSFEFKPREDHACTGSNAEGREMLVFNLHGRMLGRTRRCTGKIITFPRQFEVKTISRLPQRTL
ncbi:MAG: hypothetical protein KC983_09750 [Phycisphaerales bacterium]|nr:hypothetical protein [Phycisphaerales bacterium]